MAKLYFMFLMTSIHIFKPITITSHRHYFPMGDFTSENFSNVKFPKWRLPKGQVRPSQAPQAAMGSERCSQDGLWVRKLRLKEVTLTLRLEKSQEIAEFGVATGKITSVSCHLGKSLLESTQTVIPRKLTMNMKHMVLSRQINFP